LFQEGKDSEIVLTCNGRELKSKDRNEFFYVINDQNSRNIISEDSNEILLGDNIREEMKLINELSVKSKETIDNANSKLKGMGLSKSSQKIYSYFKNEDVLNFIKTITNNKKKY